MVQWYLATSPMGLIQSFYIPIPVAPSVEFSVFFLLEEHFLKNRGVIRRPSYEPYGQIVRDLVIWLRWKGSLGQNCSVSRPSTRDVTDMASHRDQFDVLARLNSSQASVGS